MGFDVTFHPVRLDVEGKVIRDLLLSKTTPKKVAKALPNCKDDLPQMVEENLANLVKNETNEYLACFASYNTAMLAGYLRPYWYARGQAISFYLEQHRDQTNVFTSFLKWLGEPFSNRADPTNGLIFDNWSGSGVITSPSEFLEWFSRQNFGELFDEEGLEAVRQCANCCIARGWHMLEATDVYGPSGFCTNPDNVRPPHLRNMDQA